MNFLLLCRNKKGFYLSFSIVFILWSCSKYEPEPVFRNNVLQGNISLGNSIPENVTVITHGPFGDKSVVTDNNGFFQITNLENGTYEVEFRKEGYGTRFRYGIQLFINDTINLEEILYGMVYRYIPQLSRIYDHLDEDRLPENTIAIRTDIPKESEMWKTHIRVFVSDDPNVSYLNYKYTTQTDYTTFYDSDYLLLYVRFEPDYNYYEQYRFNALFFESGSQLYIKAYICNDDEDGYFNSKLGVLVYSTVDEQECSDVLNYIIP